MISKVKNAKSVLTGDLNDKTEQLKVDVLIMLVTLVYNVVIWYLERKKEK